MAPFRQGDEEHSSISIRIGLNGSKSFWNLIVKVRNSGNDNNFNIVCFQTDVNFILVLSKYCNYILLDLALAKERGSNNVTCLK